MATSRKTPKRPAAIADAVAALERLMAGELSETVRVRVSPEGRELLERVAAREGRKLSGLIRHATVTYCTNAEAEPLRKLEPGEPDPRD